MRFHYKVMSESRGILLWSKKLYHSENSLARYPQDATLRDGSQKSNDTHGHSPAILP